MQYTNFTGKTVEDAITNASVALGVTSDQIDYVVIEKGSAGFLGIGSKDAVIRVALEEEEVPAAEAAPVEPEVAAEPAAESEQPEETAEPEPKKTESKPDPDAAASIAGEFLADMFAAMDMDVTIDGDLFKVTLQFETE